MSRQRLVAVSPVPVWPVEDGFSVRIAGLLEGLAEWWETSLIAPPDPRHRTEPDPSVTEVVPLDITVAAGPTQVKAVLDRVEPDAALIWMGAEPLIWSVPGLSRAVVDRVDSTTLTAWRSHADARGVRRRARWLRAFLTTAANERRIVRRIAATTVVATPDAKVLRRVSGSSTIHVVPNGVTLGEPPDGSRCARRPTVIFGGVLSYPPNIDALRFFVCDIWPQVLRAVPDAVFRIVGRAPTAEVLRLAERERVELRIDVPDMQSELAEAWVCVAPMISGAGIKNKVLEAWAVGRPMVMTPLAAEGLRVEQPIAPCVASGAEQFARTTIRLLQSERERSEVGRIVRATVSEHYTWRRAGASLTEILRGVSIRGSGA